MVSEITRQDLIAYVSGKCDDAELRQRIAREAKRNGSYVQQWMAEMERRAVDPFDGIDWQGVVTAGLEPAERWDVDIANGSVGHVPDVVSGQDQGRTASFGARPSARRRTVLTGVLAVAATVGFVVLLLNWPSPEGHVIARIDDGVATVTLDGSGNVSGVGQLPQELRRGVGRILADQTFERPSSLPLSRSSDTEVVPSRLISPVATIVLSDKPLFRWHPFEDAEVYEIVVYDSDLNRVNIGKAVTDQTEFTPAVPLKRGTYYSWELLRRANEGRKIYPSSPVLFKVASDAQVARIEEAKRQAGGSHLAMLVVFVEEGMLDQAKRELDVLEAKNPQSTVVERLRSELANLRR